jgi:DNA repair protein RecN (Recombination protein N)
MLQSLHIENYALIECLEINFSKGFSVITGETGAGKSIMLGALSLILGSRADTKVLMNEKKKCVIEGCFEISEYTLQAFFVSHDLDYEPTSLLRREISPSGKSRAFINDTPVTLNVLKELGDRLVNIHSQHETITLNDANFQLAVIDSYVGHENDLQDYKQKYTTYKKHIAELNALFETDSKAKSNSDYLQFQFDELEKANLTAGEQEELEEEMKILSHAEEIKSGMLEVVQKLDGSEMTIIDQLNGVHKIVTQIGSFHHDLQSLSERLTSSLIELKDISRELNNIEESVNIDPAQLNEINERLNLIYQLQQKHRLQTVGELIELRESLEQNLVTIDSLDSQINSLKTIISKEEIELNNFAQKLSQNRKNHLAEIETNIIELLQQLGMPDARFNVLMEPLAELGKEGIDKVKFLFNANKGAKLNEISRIASGGELSRLMLAIKSIISSKLLLPTIIFDEIDMGISGEVAAKVGEILSNMSMSMQLIAITHLPQIAGKGNAHFKVYKDNKGEVTHSFIEKLDQNERIFEIAKMMSGAEVTKVAIKNARILLS